MLEPAAGTWRQRRPKPKWTSRRIRKLIQRCGDDRVDRYLAEVKMIASSTSRTLGEGIEKMWEKDSLWLRGGGLVHNEAIGSCIPLWRDWGRCGLVLPFPSPVNN